MYVIFVVIDLQEINENIKNCTKINQKIVLEIIEGSPLNVELQNTFITVS
jgi:hypothetical protein